MSAYMTNLNNFISKIGLEDSSQWELRGGKQYLSPIYEDETIAQKTAAVVDKALGTVEAPPVEVVKSRSGGFRVLMNYAPIYDIFIQDFLNKKPNTGG